MKVLVSATVLRPLYRTKFHVFTGKASMAGSPRALTPPTSRRLKHCWMGWRDNTGVHTTPLQQIAQDCHRDTWRGSIPTKFLSKRVERE